MSTPALFETSRKPLRSAVFIDKSGTLVEESPHDATPDRLRFMPQALEGMKLLAAQGHALVVVTSEPGLGLGLFNRAALSAMEHALATRIRKEAGVELAGFYTCPHKPGPRGEPACLCRVPAPGLLRQASLSLRLDLGVSWMVGDLLNDVEAGRRVGCRTVLLDVGHEKNWRMSPLRTPHHRAATLLEAAQLIEGSTGAHVGQHLSLEIELSNPKEVRAPSTTSGAHTGGARTGTLHRGPLRGFEPHPTREWL
jgi:D-glycero-D-manno-heptose 1,7-bisphosphate phosphatase